MPHKVIRTEADLADLVKLLENYAKPCTVSWERGTGRSIEQNALQFKWALEAAHQRGDTTPDEVRRDWKLRHGVPILRAEDDKFRAFYDTGLKALTFEQKLAAMHYVPVTSTMNVKQMTQYLDTVQRECAEQGIRLTQPVRE